MPIAPVTDWTPIVEERSNLYSKAWDAVHAVATHLQREEDSCVAFGALAHVEYYSPLLYAYLGMATGCTEWIDRAVERLNEAIEAPPYREFLPLFSGLSGLGWTVAHLRTFLNADEDTDLTEDIDRTLLACLGRSEWLGSYDLASGLVGFGLYFLERLPTRIAGDGMNFILQHLQTTAEQASNGVAWFTRPELMPEWQRYLYPDGYYNLGLAHGVPGIIYLLSEAPANKLLQGAVDWLLQQRNSPSSPCLFNSWVAPQGSFGSRLCWCYGDLGIASVLFKAARAANCTRWHSYALEILERCLMRIDEVDTGDISFFHGATGVAHMFNRIYQTEKHLGCRNAALALYERLVGILPEVLQESDRGLLNGTVGAALSILATVTNIEPQWDRLFLLSGLS